MLTVGTGNARQDRQRHTLVTAQFQQVAVALGVPLREQLEPGFHAQFGSGDPFLVGYLAMLSLDGVAGRLIGDSQGVQRDLVEALFACAAIIVFEKGLSTADIAAIAALYA